MTAITHAIRNDIRIRHPERSRGISNQQQDASTGSALQQPHTSF
ncbi:hypothetical protein [Thiomicrorhabdus marina]|nr:hypothetical protein [Thiomicrorhabdus marina]